MSDRDEAKFVQITSSYGQWQDAVFALDDQGCVWQYVWPEKKGDSKEGKWEPLMSRRFVP